MAAFKFVWQHKILFVYAGEALFCSQIADVINFVGLIDWFAPLSKHAREIGIVLLGVGSLVSVFVLAFFVYKVFLIIDGKKSSISQVLALGTARYLQLTWYALLLMVLEVLMLLVVLPVGFKFLLGQMPRMIELIAAALLLMIMILFYIATMYVPVLIIRENRCLGSSIKRSIQLLLDSWLPLIIASLEIVLAVMVLSWTLYAVWFVASFIPGLATKGAALQVGVRNVIGQWLFMTIFNTLIVLLYRKLAQRERDELMSQIPPML
jgi:hypothetical protein